MNHDNPSETDSLNTSNPSPNSISPSQPDSTEDDSDFQLNDRNTTHGPSQTLTSTQINPPLPPPNLQSQFFTQPSSMHSSTTTKSPETSTPIAPPPQSSSYLPSFLSNIPLPNIIAHPIQSTIDLYTYLINLIDRLQTSLLNYIEYQKTIFKRFLRLLVYILCFLLTVAIICTLFALFASFCGFLGLITYWLFYYITIPVQVYSFPIFFDFSATPQHPPTAFISLPSRLSPSFHPINNPLSSASHFNVLNNIPSSSNDYAHFQNSYNSPQHSPGSPFWQYTPHRLLAQDTEFIQDLLDTVFEHYDAILRDDSQYSNLLDLDKSQSKSQSATPSSTQSLSLGGYKPVSNTALHEKPNTSNSRSESGTSTLVSQSPQHSSQSSPNNLSSASTTQHAIPSPSGSQHSTQTTPQSPRTSGTHKPPQQMYQGVKHIKPVSPILKCHHLLTTLPFSPSAGIDMLNELHSITPSDQLVRAQIKNCFLQHYRVKTPLYNDLQSKIYHSYDTWTPTPMFTPSNFQPTEKVSQLPKKHGWLFEDHNVGVQTINKFPKITLPALLDSNSRYDIVLDLHTPHYNSIPQQYQSDLFSLQISFFHTNIQQYQYTEYLQAMKMLRKQQIEQKLGELELFFQYQLRSELMELQYTQLLSLLNTLESPQFPTFDEPFHRDVTAHRNSHSTTARPPQHHHNHANDPNHPQHDPHSNFHEKPQHNPGSSRNRHTNPQQFQPPFSLNPSVFIPLATSTQTFSPYSNFYQPLITPSKVSSQGSYFTTPNINTQFEAMSSYPTSPLYNYPIIRVLSHLLHYALSWINPLEYAPIYAIFSTADCIGKMVSHFISSIPRRLGLWETPITQSILLVQGYADTPKLPTHNVQIALNPLLNNHVFAFNTSSGGVGGSHNSTSNYDSLKYISSGRLHFVIQLGGIAYYMYHWYYASLVIGTVLFACLYATIILSTFLLPTSCCLYWWYSSGETRIQSNHMTTGTTASSSQMAPKSYSNNVSNYYSNTSNSNHSSELDPFLHAYQQYTDTPTTQSTQSTQSTQHLWNSSMSTYQNIQNFAKIRTSLTKHNFSQNENSQDRDDEDSSTEYSSDDVTLLTSNNNSNLVRHPISSHSQRRKNNNNKNNQNHRDLDQLKDQQLHKVHSNPNLAAEDLRNLASDPNWGFDTTSFSNTNTHGIDGRINTQLAQPLQSIQDVPRDEIHSSSITSPTNTDDLTVIPLDLHTNDEQSSPGSSLSSSSSPHSPSNLTGTNTESAFSGPTQVILRK